MLAVASVVISPLAALQADTPPPLPIPVERLAELKSHADIVAAARLRDGSPAPAELTLPQLANRREVLQHMLENYPPALRDKYDIEMPWVWLFIDQHGRPGDMRLVKGSGHQAFDSLALAALRIARYAPALVRGEPVGVWVPLPIDAMYKELAEQAPRERPGSGAPRFTPYTVKPELLNRYEVTSALIEKYPPALRAAGTGGEVGVWLYIDEQGRTAQTRIRASSGNEELDSAALAVARIMRWTPAQNREEAVGVWVAVPIVFRSNPLAPRQ